MSEYSCIEATVCSKTGVNIVANQVKVGLKLGVCGEENDTDGVNLLPSSKAARTSLEIRRDI
jgi:hypothetical protein